ncbi:MAG: inositol monophosphatase family protein [Patescibacteria group bacterium]
MINTAIKAAKAAGNLLHTEFLKNNRIPFSYKDKFDIQANLDIESAKIIKKIIKNKFPHHSIWGEESGKKINDSDYLWIIDPLDGTINFANNLEEYCISIALFKEGLPYLGVIFQPTSKRLYVAKKSCGATLNGKPIKVSKESKLINMLVATDMTSKEPYRTDSFDIMKKISLHTRHIRIFGSCALHLARLAEGKFDFYFKNLFDIWDFAAGAIIAKEAGGKVTDFSGKEISIYSKNILVSNGVSHTKLLNLFNQIDSK